MDASRRNLPSNIPGPDLSAEEKCLEDAYRRYLQQGLSPEEVAARVVSAVKEKKFYIFTHDYRDAIEKRMTNLLEEKNPQPSPPNPKLIEILESIINDR
jgi:hypothetical protein